MRLAKYIQELRAAYIRRLRKMSEIQALMESLLLATLAMPFLILILIGIVAILSH